MGGRPAALGCAGLMLCRPLVSMLQGRLAAVTVLDGQLYSMCGFVMFFLGARKALFLQEGRSMHSLILGIRDAAESGTMPSEEERNNWQRAAVNYPEPKIDEETALAKSSSRELIASGLE